MIPRFRVWNNEEKKWVVNCRIYPNGALSVDFSEGLSLGGYDYRTINPAEDTRFSIQLSTGLTDENKQEAFDGDIARITVVVDMSPGPITEDEYIMEICWKDGGFVFINPSTPFHECDLTVPDEFEVIGNIHEHSHLLEVSQ